MAPIDEYIRLADAWGQFMEDGDSKSASTLYEQIHDQFRLIGQEQQETALFERAETVSDAARFFIASHIKQRDPSRAIGLYHRLSLSSLPFIALSAKHILNEMTMEGDQ